MRQKFDLNRDVVPGISFDAVRLAFRQVGEVCSLQWLLVSLYRDRLETALLADLPGIGRLTLRQIRSFVSDVHLGIGSYPKTKELWDAVTESAPLLVERLAADGIASAENNDIFIGEAGRSLIGQKKLPRISRRRGVDALRSVLATVQRVNGDAVMTHSVVEVHLFGSLLGAADTVGDVDIIPVIRQRFRPGEDFTQWHERDEALMWTVCPSRMGGVLPPSGEHVIRKALKRSSRHASIMHEMMLKFLAENGEPCALVFSADPGKKGIAEDELDRLAATC